jgi:integrase
MVENGDLEFNFVPGIKKVKQNPVKNHPYSPRQMQDIKTYLLANDPYLLDFIRVLGYSFLRNREVLRLKVKNIDLRNRMLTDKTKAKALEKIFIVDQLHEYFTALDLRRLNSEDYIFTG